jgi:hypothetical protein
VKQGKTLYHCHNCNITFGFEKFLKTVDEVQFKEYTFEKLKDSKSPQALDLQTFVNKMKKPVFMQTEPFKGLLKVSQLDPDDPVKKLVVARKIPNIVHSKLFKCPKFFTWTNTIVPNKFSDEALLYDETRLLIPFLTKEKTMHAFQGRSLDSKSKTKYITIITNEEVDKLYGLDTLDVSKKIYVTEGPIDSMFLPNGIATAGGDLTSSVKNLPKANLVIVYDNEPRSLDTKKKIDKAIINGYNVCIWPSNLEYKDINDAILGGLSPEFIQYIIDTNTYRDLRAKLALKTWSKV